VRQAPAQLLPPAPMLPASLQRRNHIDHYRDLTSDFSAEHQL